MARRAARVTMEETAIVMEDMEEMIEMDTVHQVTASSLLDELLPPDTEGGITKEQDEEIMKAKQRQVLRTWSRLLNISLQDVPG